MKTFLLSLVICCIGLQINAQELKFTDGDFIGVGFNHHYRGNDFEVAYHHRFKDPRHIFRLGLHIFADKVSDAQKQSLDNYYHNYQYEAGSLAQRLGWDFTYQFFFKNYVPSEVQWGLFFRLQYYKLELYQERFIFNPTLGTSDRVIDGEVTNTFDNAAGIYISIPLSRSKYRIYASAGIGVLSYQDYDRFFSFTTSSINYYWSADFSYQIGLGVTRQIGN